MTDVGAARVEITGDVRTFAKKAERDIDRALTTMKLDPIKIDFDEGQLRKDSDKLGTLINAAFVIAGVGSAKAFAKGLAKGLAALPSLILPTLIVAGLGIAAALAAVIGPALGALIASSVLTAAGLGLVGLGAVLLREEPRLVSAAEKLMGTVKKVFTNAAQPLLSPLVAALGIFEKSAIRIGPALKTAFTDIAPAIKPFATALTAMVENTLPGFNDLIQASNVFLQRIAQSLPGLGQSFSNFFGNIASVGPEAAIFFSDFIDAIGATIRWLGEFIAWLTTTYITVKNFFSNARQSIEDFRNSVEGLSIGEIFRTIKDELDPSFFDNIIEAFHRLVDVGIQYLIDNLPGIIDNFLAMKDMVIDAALRLVQELADNLPKIIPAVISTLLDLLQGAVDTLVEIVPQLIEAASALVDGLVDGLILAMPALIQGGVQLVTTLVVGIIGLIPLLIQAGIRLIEGLVEGFFTALPQIQMALITAIPQIISALITAIPSLILAGIQIIQAVVQGIGDSIPFMVDVIQNEVIPLLLQTLSEQGPLLLQQGVEALKSILQGMIDSATTIGEVITTQIIPAITAQFENNPELLQAGLDVLKTLYQALADNITVLTTWVTDTFVPQFTALLKDNPEIIDSALGMLLSLIQGLTDNMVVITDFITETLIPILTKTIEDNGPALAEAGLKIMIALSVGFAKALPQIIGALFLIAGAIISGIIQIVPRMIAAGIQLIASLVGAMLSAWATRTGQLISSIKNGIVGAFSGAASWLADAGKKIINGLIDGIQSGFDRVRGLLNTLTGLLPDWKGPAAVDEKILFGAGQMVMKGFQSGIEDQRDSIRRSLRDITGDLPSWAGGAVRGGDGAAAGGRGANVEKMEINIYGQGKAAGEEAVTAILEGLGQATLMR